MDTVAHDHVFQSKINHACLVIEQCLGTYEKPAILCSFGTRSLVLLWMIREWFSKEIPVVFFKQQAFPRKYAFAERIAAEWEVDVYSNIPPRGYSLTTNAQVVQHFSLGQADLLLPVGRQSIENKPRWICGADHFLKGPLGTFSWPWDVVFCGHSSSQIGPMMQRNHAEADLEPIPNSCHLAYPLRHFDEQDIQKAYQAWGLPVNRLRDDNGRDPEGFFEDNAIPYCSKCFDPKEGQVVTCPKSGLKLTNKSASLVFLEPKPNQS